MFTKFSGILNNRRGRLYTDEESIDMIRCYYMSGCIASKASELYAKLYPDRRVPIAKTIYKQVVRGLEDPNIDMSQLKLMVEDPREICRIRGTPIVYTTRLDEMKVFQENTENLNYRKFMKYIKRESKPKLKNLVTRKRRPKRNNSFNQMTQKLNAMKRKLSEKIDSDDDVVVIDCARDTAGSGCKPDAGSQEKNKAESFKRRKTLDTFVDALEDDYQLNTVQEKSSEQTDSTSNMNDEVDCLIVPPKAFQALVNKYHSTQKPQTESTIEVVDNDTETAQNNVQDRASANSSKVHLYWKVYLSFVCKYSNVNDLYYVDKDGSVTDYYRININENYEVSELNTFVGPVKTIVFRCCCWYKRQEFISLLCTIPKSSVAFMSKPHNCTPLDCSCCCRKKKKIVSNAATSSAQTSYDEDGALMLLEQEITNALLKIAQKHEQRKMWVVEGINKWLQDLQKTLKSTVSTTLINKGLMKIKMQTKTPGPVTVSPNKFPRDVWAKGHVVVHIESEKSKQIQICEFFQGALLSTATIFGFNKKLRDLANFLASKLFDTYEHLPRHLNVIRKIRIPCCWYLREALIKHKTRPSTALNFIRQPHFCPVESCKCCCKSESEDSIMKTAKGIKLYDEIYKAVKKPTCPYTQKPTTKQRSLPIQRPSPLLSSKVLQVEVSPETNTLSDQILQGPVSDQSSPPSVVHNDIIDIDDDDVIEVTPSATSTRTLSNSVPHTESNPYETPSSKITLFSSDLACTITTYSVNQNEAAKETDDVEADPLSMPVIEDNDNDALGFDGTRNTNDDVQKKEDHDPLDLDSTPVNTVDDSRDPLGIEETLKIEQTLAETTNEDEIEENTNLNKDTPPRSEATPQPINKYSQRNLNVELLISTILDRFRDVRLYINDEGNVTADLNAPVSSLKTAELKVLANILAHAQEQVKSMRLRPGTILNGQFGMAGQLARNLNPNDPASALYSPENSVEPRSTEPVNSPEQFMPRIENVFSLTDNAQQLIEASENTESNRQTNEKPKIRVRPPEELSVAETAKQPLLQNLLNAPKVFVRPIPDCPIFLSADKTHIDIMPQAPLCSYVPTLNNVEQLIMENRAPRNSLPDLVTSSIQTTSNPAYVDASTSTQSLKQTKNKRPNQSVKSSTPKTQKSYARTKKSNTQTKQNNTKKKELVPVSDILQTATAASEDNLLRPMMKKKLADILRPVPSTSGENSPHPIGTSVPLTKNISIVDVIEIDDD